MKALKIWLEERCTHFVEIEVDDDATDDAIKEAAIEQTCYQDTPEDRDFTILTVEEDKTSSPYRTDLPGWLLEEKVSQ